MISIITPTLWGVIVSRGRWYHCVPFIYWWLHYNTVSNTFMKCYIIRVMRFSMLPEMIQTRYQCVVDALWCLTWIPSSGDIDVLGSPQSTEAGLVSKAWSKDWFALFTTKTWISSKVALIHRVNEQYDLSGAGLEESYKQRPRVKTKEWNTYRLPNALFSPSKF